MFRVFPKNMFSKKRVLFPSVVACHASRNMGIKPRPPGTRCQARYLPNAHILMLPSCLWPTITHDHAEQTNAPMRGGVGMSGKRTHQPAALMRHGRAICVVGIASSIETETSMAAGLVRTSLIATCLIKGCLHRDAIGRGDDDRRGHTNEEPVVNNAHLPS